MKLEYVVFILQGMIVLAALIGIAILAVRRIKTARTERFEKRDN